MKLEFKEIEKGILAYKAKSEYKQAAIIIVRNIFIEAETKQLSLTGVVQAKPDKLFCEKHTPKVRYEWEKDRCLECGEEIKQL